MTFLVMTSDSGMWTDFFQTDFLTGTTIGLALLVVGLVVTWFSAYRYLLGYFLAGMGYWLAVEGLQWSAVQLFPISDWHGYVVALTASWFIPVSYFIYRYLRTPAGEFNLSSLAPMKRRTRQESYIEHTPIYQDYKPRFHS